MTWFTGVSLCFERLFTPCLLSTFSSRSPPRISAGGAPWLYRANSAGGDGTHSGNGSGSGHGLTVASAAALLDYTSSMSSMTSSMRSEAEGGGASSGGSGAGRPADEYTRTLAKLGMFVRGHDAPWE